MVLLTAAIKATGLWLDLTGTGGSKQIRALEKNTKSALIGLVVSLRDFLHFVFYNETVTTIVCTANILVKLHSKSLHGLHSGFHVRLRLSTKFLFHLFKDVLHSIFLCRWVHSEFRHGFFQFSDGWQGPERSGWFLLASGLSICCFGLQFVITSSISSKLQCLGFGDLLGRRKRTILLV